MTLDELLQKVPEAWRPAARQYGPVLLAMTAEEVWAWIQLAGQDAYRAYGELLERLPPDEVVAQWGDVKARWQEANAENARQIDIQKQVAMAVTKVALGLALAVVGL